MGSLNVGHLNILHHVAAKTSSPAIEMSIFIHIQYIVLYIPNLEHIIDYMISL